MKPLKLTRKPIAELKPNARNPRTISPKALAGLQESLSQFGYVQPIIWNRRTGRVVGGHQRLRALQASGETHADVLVVSFPAKQELAANISLNNPAIQGRFTPELQDLLTEAQGDLGEVYESLRLDELESTVDARRLHPERTEATGLERSQEPITKRGDIWVVGENRIGCADATNPQEINALMGGLTPGIMVTDPPYGVNYDPAWRTKLGTKRMRKDPSANDDRDDWREAYRLFPGDIAYVWHAALGGLTVADGLEEAGFQIRTQIVWAKSAFVLSRGAYHWQHELAWYAVRRGKPAHWEGERGQSSVWYIPNPNPFGGSSGEDETNHSAQKPIECMARPIRHHRPPSPHVYDPFLGSGTTWLAAAETGRPFIGCDIQPGWVDAAIRRWVASGHQAPTREQDGTTFPIGDRRLGS